MNIEAGKNKFSWKGYLKLVIISEILNILILFRLSRISSDGSAYLFLSFGICFLHSLVIFIGSIIEIAKYKKSKSKGCNSTSNKFIVFFSSLMISFGGFIINQNIGDVFALDNYRMPNISSSALLILGIGIALIFPVVTKVTKKETQ